ncbi:MAG: hypothetical protein IKQ10_01950 [Oscillospiraceae bacterium]|nr:hypothetical protein [Oscillospiraceae bacterium]
MQKSVVVPLLLVLLLSAGCAAPREEREFSEFRQRLAAAEAFSFDTAVTSRHGEFVSSCAMRVTCRDGEVRAEVTAPENIAGVVCRSSGSGGTLEYDGLILELTPGDPEALPPCEAGRLFSDALRTGRFLCGGRADGYLTAALETDGGETVTLWRTAENVPVYAEIGRGGAAELTMTIENWTIGE